MPRIYGIFHPLYNLGFCFIKGSIEAGKLIKTSNSEGIIKSNIEYREIMKSKEAVRYEPVK
jgi:hypothetical protein